VFLSGFRTQVPGDATPPGDASSSRVDRPLPGPPARCRREHSLPPAGRHVDPRRVKTRRSFRRSLSPAPPGGTKTERPLPCSLSAPHRLCADSYSEHSPGRTAFESRGGPGEDELRPPRTGHHTGSRSPSPVRGGRPEVTSRVGRRMSSGPWACVRGSRPVTVSARALDVSARAISVDRT
jgi:hypothetical protein